MQAYAYATVSDVLSALRTPTPERACCDFWWDSDQKKVEMPLKKLVCKSIKKIGNQVLRIGGYGLGAGGTDEDEG